MYNFHKKEAPLLGLLGSGGSLASILTGSAAASLYVDDVFRTFVYDGNGGVQTINNGIDLSDEGGLVWIKNRTQVSLHRLVDTERGATKSVKSNADYVETTETAGLSAFTSTGFTLGDNSTYNPSGVEMCSWTFRKSPGFFDVVTYTGTGSARTIAHNLGSVPGMILIKCTSTSHNWRVYHRSLGKDYYGGLNSANAFQPESGTGYAVWNNTEPTSSVFSVGTAATVNQDEETYVAYIFAHDVQEYGKNADQSIIKCGKYTGNGSTPQTINLGFEPQWVMVKGSTLNLEDWNIYDNMRGVNENDSNDRVLRANTTNYESGQEALYFTQNGFRIKGSRHNTNGHDWIYVAIRRPHKPPSAATEVFKPVLQTSRGTVSTGFPVDMVLFGDNGSSWGYNWTIQNRLTGGTRALITSNTGLLELNTATSEFDSNTSFEDGWVSGSTTGIYEAFRRAPGFYDTVAYTGDSTANQQFAHNLGAVPELIITKVRNSYNRNWAVYSSVTGTGKWLEINNDTQAQTGSGKFDTAPTSTDFYVSHDSSFMTGGGGNYVAHLFATLPKISKVGSYTGTGSDIDVDCGFTAGARFVMIKRTDDTGDWYVWDTARGIVSGNDPYFKLNDDATSVTSTDYIDPLNSGFTVTSSAPDSINVGGGTYLFLAIA
jgi:hypothetical protein